MRSDVLVVAGLAVLSIVGPAFASSQALNSGQVLSDSQAADPAKTSAVPPPVGLDAPSRDKQPWANRALLPEQRAKLILDAMTLDEKIALVHTRLGTPFHGHPAPAGALNAAGFAPGIPRLAIPPLQETDAGLGIANPTNARVDATPLPSGLALGATFDPSLAFAGGAMIGAEARAKGFSMLLAGGANLTRDPRNGRNFEYIGEDPLLTGTMAGAVVAGVQSRGVMSTLKHFAINDQETGRMVVNSEIAEASARESDLLAFEIALERGTPGAVMTSYNRVNGDYASENTVLITEILKGDWRFKGWVMSDWGGTHSTEKAALAGLDQESGEDFDPLPLFGAPLKNAVDAGRVPLARLDDMVLRLLRAELRAGVIDDPPRPGGAFDKAKDAAIAEDVARQGIVLLKNADGILPLQRSLRRVLVIGDNADFGVLSGGGSSQVVPLGALRMQGDPPGRFYGKPKLYDPSSPLLAIRRALPDAAVDFRDGRDHAAAADAARQADVVLVFAEQWMNEGCDAPNLTLPKDQDSLIAAVAAANRKTIVILETGGPVRMPWLSSVPAVAEAWYPGARGAEAIASVLLGTVDPSGRLPITFPQDEAQLPRSTIQDPDKATANPGEALKGPAFSVDYNIEGADVGYKWFARTGRAPLFPFGYGLSYTRFTRGPVHVIARGGRVTLRFDVANTGAREGIDTPQIYVESQAGLFNRRLAGWRRVALRPGEKRRIVITIDPRLLARFDVKGHRWHIEKGLYTASVQSDATSRGPVRRFAMTTRDLSP